MSPERGNSNLSRAEQLRQKHQQTSQQRVSQVRQQATRVTGQSVNTTARRSSPYAVPLSHSVRSANVRKVHYAQTGNGVEVRLPSIPSIPLNWQVASAVLAFVVLILVVILTTAATFQVQNVEVTGISRISAADIQTVVDGANRSIFTLDRQKTINAIVTAFPELTDIHLKVKLPNTVVLTVTERQPIASWVGPESTQWIDSEGVVFPERGDGGSLMSINSSTSAPLLSTASASEDAETADAEGKENADAAPVINYIDPKVLQTAISLGAQLPSGATLVYDPISGMGWNDSRGWNVYFGIDMSNIAFKLAEYQTIIETLTKKGIQPTLVSVAFVDAPYYSTR
jgi:cell division protein FtsQ